MIGKKRRLLKKLQKEFEPRVLDFLRDEGIIQKGEIIEFEWRFL